MAGAGYKLFNTGDVLTAAQVNTYLMEQTVMVFNDAASRTTALSGVVAEGMLSYLKSTKQVEVYNGTAWVASDDPNAIQNTIVDAKGDLITATANDTPARLAVGNNGETLVADSSASTGLRWQSNFAAGKNKIINGDFNIWQRGTSFTNPTDGTYTTDRCYIAFGGNATAVVSRQTFTPGNTIAGYEPSFFWRWATTTAGTTTEALNIQRIEDVRTFAGQTVTFSFWAKADTTRVGYYRIDQNFGSGGSSYAAGTAVNFTMTTSWQRFTFTYTVPSIAGKTIGSNSSLVVLVAWPIANGSTFDTWGWQLEAGNVATAFQTATGTLAGELAACQRYYFRLTAGDEQPISNQGFFFSSSAFGAQIPFKVQMRTAPTSIDFSQIAVSNYNGYYSEATGATLVKASAYQALVNATGLTGGTAGSAYGVLVAFNAGRTGYLGFNAEL